MHLKVYEWLGKKCYLISIERISALLNISSHYLCMAYSAKIRDVISQFINRVLERTRKVIGGMYMYYKNTVIKVIGRCSLKLKIASPRQLVACSFKLKCHFNISCSVRLTAMYS